MQRLYLFFVLLVGVLLDFRCDDHEFDSCQFEQVPGFAGRMILLFADHALDSAIHDGFGASIARLEFPIDRGAVNRDSIAGRIANGVYLPMGRADAMLGHGPVFMSDLVQLMAFIIAMRHADRRAHIPGREDALVFDEHHADAPAVASAALADCARDLQKILVSRRPDVLLFVCHIKVTSYKLQE